MTTETIPPRLSWTQPICENCWINQHATWEDDPEGGKRLATIKRPVILREPDIERCSYCGLPTIFGAYQRDDPANVPYPAEKND